MSMIEGKCGCTIRLDRILMGCISVGMSEGDMRCRSTVSNFGRDKMFLYMSSGLERGYFGKTLHKTAWIDTELFGQRLTLISYETEMQ